MTYIPCTPMSPSIKSDWLTSQKDLKTLTATWAAQWGNQMSQRAARRKVASWQLVYNLMGWKAALCYEQEGRKERKQWACSLDCGQQLRLLTISLTFALFPFFFWGTLVVALTSQATPSLHHFFLFSHDSLLFSAFSFSLMNTPFIMVL